MSGFCLGTSWQRSARSSPLARSTTKAQFPFMVPTMSDDDEVLLQTRKFRPRVEAMLLLLLLVVLVVVVNEPLDVVLRLHYHVESSC